MDTTPVYGLAYPTGSDLVSGAPAQLEKMASTFESALVEVDNRNTPAGVKPVIATTLANLALQTGVTGQTGYVTADPTTTNNGPYVWTGKAWEMLATLSQITQGYLSAKFKFQNTGSFVPDSYGGGMEIIVDQGNRLLHVNLSGFRSTVNVNSYPVFLYASGVKPSKDISLSCIFSLPSGSYAKQATWLANGSINIIGGLSNGDRCIHTPRTLPIPDGVTFA